MVGRREYASDARGNRVLRSAEDVARELGVPVEDLKRRDRHDVDPYDTSNLRISQDGVATVVNGNRSGETFRVGSSNAGELDLMERELDLLRLAAAR